VHPVHVEAVANVVGRGELMAALWTLLAVYSAVVRESPTWSGVALACGLLSKENAAVAPALAALAWVLGVARPPRRTIVALTAAWAVAGGAYAVARWAVLHTHTGFADIAPVFQGADGLSVRLTAAAALADVARLLVFPLTLRVDYSLQERTLVSSVLDTRLLAGVLCTAIWAALVAVAWRRGRRVEAYGLVWIAVALLPVANLLFPVGVLVAERTLYLPSAGLAVAAGAWLGGLRSRLAPALVGLGVVAAAARTAWRVPVWRDDTTVTVSILADSPRSYRGPQYAAALLQAGRNPARALAYYRAALALYDRDARLVAIGGLLIAHLAMANQGGGYSGVLLILDQLFAVALVLGMFAIAAGVGGRLLKAGGLRLERPLEALLFGTTAGLGTLATAIFALGWLSVRPVVLLAVLVGAAFIGRNELRELPLLVKDVLACLRARANRLSLSVFVVIALVVITGALTPPTDWDALMYHLRVPQQFLEHGSIYLTEDNAHWAFVSLPHMLYLPLLALGIPAGPALVSALCTLAIALAMFAFALRFLDQRTAGFSLAVLWGSGMLVLVAISPRIDTILALYLFLVHYAVICAMESKDARFLYLSAALAGMAVGVKYNALAYLLALAPLGGWVVVVRLQ